MKNKLFVIDEQTHFMFSAIIKKNDNVIINEKQINTAFLTQNTEKIILLAELGWEGHYLNEFYGFKLLCDFRTNYGLKCPVAICSFMKFSWLIKRFPILNLPKHHCFISLQEYPLNIDLAFQDTESVDESRLNDIINSYCDIYRRLTKLITHGKGFREIIKFISGRFLEQEMWDNCTNDLRLLDNYLGTDKIKSSIVKKGNILSEVMREVIALKDSQRLLKIKPILFDILDEIEKRDN